MTKRTMIAGPDEMPKDRTDRPTEHGLGDGAAPSICRRCAGRAATVPIVRRFAHVDYGHMACRTCRITFDSNVNEMLGERLDATAIRDLSDEAAYRRLFVETSRIADASGDIYPNFDWEDNEALKGGVVRHVTGALETHGDGDRFERILDLGCGNGFSSVEIAQRMDGVIVTAVDPSPMVLSAGQHERVEPIQGTLDSLKLPANFYDGVVIVGNLMLHSNPATTLAEAVRVLRPGGLLILDFKNVDSTVRRVVARSARWGLVGRLPRRLVERSVVNMRFGFNRDFVRELLDGSGLVEVASYSKPPRLLEFRNAASWQRGWMGAVWRLTDTIDGLRDQRAWVQMVFRKPRADG